MTKNHTGTVFPGMSECFTKWPVEGVREWKEILHFVQDDNWGAKWPVEGVREWKEILHFVQDDNHFVQDDSGERKGQWRAFGGGRRSFTWVRMETTLCRGTRGGAGGFP